MGMPKIEGSDVERSQSITDLIESVALQEAALSHILNAEGEKLQAFVKLLEDESTEINPEMMLDVNNSVTDLVTAVSSVESHLQAKLALFAEYARISFYFMKKTSNGDYPLADAVFELNRDNSPIATAVSDMNGVVLFHDIPAGVYTLREVSAPPNFNPDPNTYTVIANASTNVTIDRVPADEFIVYNSSSAN